MRQRGMIRALCALVVGVLSFGITACARDADMSEEEIARVHSAIVDGARAIPGVTDVKLGYKRWGPTGSLMLEGYIHVASADPVAAREAFEELHRIAAGIVPDREDGHVRTYILSDEDENFRLDAKDLGFTTVNPSFHAVIEAYGN